VDLEDNDRARLDGESHGLLKVHLAAGTDRILGATLVASHAGEMIGEMAVAITNGLRLGQVGRTIHAYPTQAEVFRRAADAWRKRAFTHAPVLCLQHGSACSASRRTAQQPSRNPGRPVTAASWTDHVAVTGRGETPSP
jgi:hypothetical protein